jgi:hypothetical protein
MCRTPKSRFKECDLDGVTAKVGYHNFPLGANYLGWVVATRVQFWALRSSATCYSSPLSSSNHLLVSFPAASCPWRCKKSTSQKSGSLSQQDNTTHPGFLMVMVEPNLTGKNATKNNTDNVGNGATPSACHLKPASSQTDSKKQRGFWAFSEGLFSKRRLERLALQWDHLTQSRCDLFRKLFPAAEAPCEAWQRVDTTVEK